MRKNVSKKNFLYLDITILLLFVLFAVAITEWVRPVPLFSMFLFFVVPSIYLLIRKKKLPAIKIWLTSLTIGITAGAVDAAITANKGWWIPEGQLVFTHRFFEIWNIDNTLWYIGLIFYIVTFYEYFLDEEKHRKLSARFPLLVWLPVLTSFILIAFAIFFPIALASVRYAYLTLAVPFVLLPIILLFRWGRNVPLLLGKFSLVAAFFFIVNIAHEITALRWNQWVFPGEYIGTVNVLNVVIPIEEFILYIIMSAFIGLAYYEVFVDDAS